MYFYSPSTGFFYHSAVNPSMPSDVISITNELQQQLQEERGNGKEIVMGPNGLPIAVDPTPVDVSVPAWVSLYQGRSALISAGLDEDVEAAIEAIPDITKRKLTRNAYEHAQTIQRDSEFTIFLAGALGLSDTQLDDLFIAASQVQ